MNKVADIGIVDAVLDVVVVVVLKTYRSAGDEKIVIILFFLESGSSRRCKLFKAHGEHHFLHHQKR